MQHAKLELYSIESKLSSNLLGNQVLHPLSFREQVPVINLELITLMVSRWPATTEHSGQDSV